MRDEKQKPSVLIVDDVPTNIQILAESLAGDYRVKVATSGQSALEIVAKQERPDIILLDVMMPQMDGYEVCARLKQDAETKNIPVIFVTAMDEAVDEEHGISLGAVDYITKPFHLPIIKARLKNHIKHKLMTDQLESMVWLDALTSIPNRRRFDEELEREWKRAQRSGTTLSVILVDVDHFKDFNDQYGHGAGDVCLKKVALTLAASVTRAGDLVARYGGEEFIVLTPETDIAGVRVLAEQLRGSIEALQITHEHSSVLHRVTISAGYASVIPEHGKSALVLVEEADRMLYCAKRAGRNRVYGLRELKVARKISD
jgi:diguanylate cyclase (GGDEF)-like protein